MLNYTPYDSEGPEFPLPRGRPRLVWVIPVDMGELGASLQAISFSMPQTTTLRLCHRFRGGPLSRLPQELLEQIVDEVQQKAKAEQRPKWYQDSVCWQGTCLPEDHYSVYNDTLEKLWQKIYIEKAYGPTYGAHIEGLKKEDKVEMVQGWIGCRPNFDDIHEGLIDLHYEATSRWLDRTCLCPRDRRAVTANGGSFVPLNEVSVNNLVHQRCSDNCRL
jgi:hypothetical protein